MSTQKKTPNPANASPKREAKTREQPPPVCEFTTTRMPISPPTARGRPSEQSQFALDLGDARLHLAAVDLAELLRQELAARALEHRAEDLHLALAAVRRRDEVGEGLLQVLRRDLRRLRGLGLEDRAHEHRLEIRSREAEQLLLAG